MNNMAIPYSSGEQVTMGNTPPQEYVEKASELARETLGSIPRLLGWNCLRLVAYSAESRAMASEYAETPQAALLAFMMHATPNEGLATSIYMSPSKHLDNMSLTFTPHLINEDTPASTAFEVHGVPDTTDKVKGRMAWVQVPKEGGNGEMGLELVWKVCKSVHDKQICTDHWSTCSSKFP